MRTTLAAALLVVALAAGTVAVGVQGSPGNETTTVDRPTVDASGPSDGKTAVALYQTTDGEWVVVETNKPMMGGGHSVGAERYRHAGDWTGPLDGGSVRTGNESFRATAAADDPAGGWIVVDSDGDLHRFSSDWEYENESIATADPPLRRLAPTADGGWIGTAARAVLVADGALNGTWTAVPLADLPGDVGVVHAMAYADGRLVLVGAGETVYEYAVAEPSAAGVAAAELVTERDLRHGPDRVTDVHRGDGGDWWLLSPDGTAYRYGDQWFYTGVSYEFGSDRPYHVSDVVTFPPLPSLRTVLVAGFLVYAGAAVVAAPTAHRRRVLLTVAGVAAVAFGVFLPPFVLRPHLVDSLHRVTVVGALSLVGPAVAVARYDASLRYRAVYALTFAPVVAGGVRWLTAVL